MRLETKSGRHKAEIICYLNATDKQPFVVLLTNKENGDREINYYDSSLKFLSEGGDSGFDLVGVEE